MAIASNFLIAANDEHGLNPPTVGKRTPVLPYINRPFYENEINRTAKNAFILACVRCGFRVYDAHPEITDTSVGTRVRRVNSVGASLCVTFAFNAYGNGQSFNNANGYIVFYSRNGFRPTQSRLLCYDISASLSQTLPTKNLGVGTLTDIGILESVRMPSALIEGGFMTNFNEAKLMLNPDFATALGEGACRGVCEFLDVEFVEREGTYPTISRGSRGKWVRLLQYALSFDGYDIGAKDGVFGANTERVVKAFQTANSLTADGIVGRNTWNALLKFNPPTLRRGNRGTWVKYLQNFLLSKLYNIGTSDGIFGRNTENAVLDFQRENGLLADGIVGANTWNALKTLPGRPLP